MRRIKDHLRSLLITTRVQVAAPLALEFRWLVKSSQDHFSIGRYMVQIQSLHPFVIRIRVIEYPFVVSVRHIRIVTIHRHLVLANDMKVWTFIFEQIKSIWMVFRFRPGTDMLRITPDEKIDLKLFKKLIARVEKEIHKAPNRVRYCMNQFLIAAGSFSKALNKDAIEAGKRIGVVMVDMGGTACKVPYAPDYIKKVMDKGYLGKKRKSPKC